ncbi:hypothetical protein D3C84_797560 [compost metagenome]
MTDINKVLVQPKGLTVRLEDEVFHVINQEARKHKMKLGEFCSYLVECYAAAISKQEGVA